MKYFPKFFWLAAALFFSPLILHAQIPGTTPPPIDPAMLKLFGKNTNFTAVADIRVFDNAKKETMSMTLGVALLDGKLRAEMDLAHMKSQMISAETLGQIKQMGAEKTIYIMHQESRTSYVIYPALNAYAQLPLSTVGQQKRSQEKLQQSPVSKETIEGHTCIKNKILESEEIEQLRGAIVWNATDLKEFPLQMEIKEKNSVILMKFKNLKFGKPEAKQFQPPTDYARYQSLSELQRVMVDRLLGTMRK